MVGDANRFYWVGSRDAKCPAVNGPILSRKSSVTQNASIGLFKTVKWWRLFVCLFKQKREILGNLSRK